MNILYLGAFLPDFLVKRSGGDLDSLYRASQSLIQGLRNHIDIKLKVITSPDIASWPNGPLFVSREKCDEEELTMVSSLNISLIKQVWTIISMTREASRYIRQNDGQTIVMIPYVVFRHVFTLRLLHWLYPRKVVQACIVPDIFFPRKRIGKMVNAKTERMASRFDAFVFYTAKMADRLCVKEQRYVVIEGFREVLNRKPVGSDCFKVVYAGTLNLNYGIGRLVDAMALIEDSDIELHLYGAGSGITKIQDAAVIDSRIKYHGRVSNAVATDAIYSASVLINPRNASDGEFTEYSFPSKDIEYLSTGIPTLLCKLPGMPSEYYGHFVDMGEATPNQIATAIKQVKSMSVIERESIGQAARSFIIERMDSTRQAEKIKRLFVQVMDETCC